MPYENNTPQADLKQRTARELAERAQKMTIRALKKHGNEVSVDHAYALLRSANQMAEAAVGLRTGASAIDLATGLGKSTLIICFTKCAAAMGLFKRGVLVAVERIDQMLPIYNGLTNGADAVPEQDIGVWHSKHRLLPAPSHSDKEATKYENYKVLLVTHARLRLSGKRDIALRYRGQARGLLLWDEALEPSKLERISYPELAGALQEAVSFSKAGTTLHKIASKLLGKLERLTQGTANGKLRSLASISICYEETTMLIEAADQLSKRNKNLLKRFLKHPIADWSFFQLGKGNYDRILVREDQCLPTALPNMVVFDASYPFAHKSAQLVAGGATPDRYIKHYTSTSLTNAGQPVKRYDNVTICMMSTTRSGKSAIEKQCVKHLNEGDTIFSEVAHLLRSLPESEPVLLFTFKENDGETYGPPCIIEAALKQAGIDLAKNVLVDGKERKRINIRTYGQETASNDLSHCKYVVFVGMLEKPRTDLAVHQMLRVGTSSIDPTVVTDLQIQAEGSRLFQGMSRGAMRRTEVDELGRTQAAETTVYVFARHRKQLKEVLCPLLPGCKWGVWKRVDEGKTPKSKTDAVAKAIVQIANNLPDDQTSISVSKLRELVIAKAHPRSKNTFTKAVNAALETLPWERQGRSIIRKN